MKQNALVGLGLLCYLCAPLLSAAETPRSIDAQLFWGQRLSLGLAHSGIIAAVKVKAGDKVKAGETLLHLQQGLFQADIKVAQAALSKANAAHAENKRELERTQALHQQTLISEHEMQLVQTAFAGSEAAVHHAQARLLQARELQQQSVLKSPFAGRIIARYAEPGQAVVNHCQLTPLLVLADTRQISVRGLLTADDLKHIKLTQVLEVQIDGRRYQGEVVNLGWEATEQQGQVGYLLEVLITTEDQLRAGMNATILY